MIRELTPPIRVGKVLIGESGADVAPFECADFDFARVNEYLARNPAVRKHIIPDAMIFSCSECCMEQINGKPNILGILFRKSREGKGCSLCPVSMATEKLPARTADGDYVRSITGSILSEADIIRLSEDGTA